MQSRLGSIIEASANIAIGAGVALTTQIIVFPWFGLHPSLHENLMITVIFTFVSFVRSYLCGGFLIGSTLKGGLGETSPYYYIIIHANNCSKNHCTLRRRVSIYSNSPVFGECY